MGFINIMAVIHPRWVMDEYAIIARSLDWFMPNIPPTSALEAAIMIVVWYIFLAIINDRNINGASFCHVDKIRQFIHDRDVITEGYHRWNGANPILSARLIIKIVYVSLVSGELNHINILDISSSLDPSAWFRKYFTHASVSWNCLVDNIIGMKHNKFSSIAIHINIQFVLDRANIVLAISDR